MEKVSIVGMDLAKNVFHVHGARSDGSVSFRKKLSRNKVLMFFAAQPKCVVAIRGVVTLRPEGNARAAADRSC